MERLLITLTLISLPAISNAQGTGAIDNPVIIDGVNFFICVVAGVLLALGFQLILTMLSVATGISAVGNVQKKANKDSSSSSSSSNTGKKVSTGIGLWTMITASLSLFFASLLAVKLSLIGINFIGVTLGLVIWASFFIIMTYLEMNAVTSMVGGLVSTVSEGMKGVFTKSETSKAESLAKVQSKESAKAMRKQFEKLFDNNDLDRKIEDYIDKLAPQRIDINHIKREIKSLLTDIQAKEVGDFKNRDVIKKIILEEAESSKLSKEDMDEVKNQVQGLGEIARKDTSNEEKAKQGIGQLTNTDQEQINQYQERIKQILRSSGNKELQPEKLERDLEAIFNEPQRANDVVRAKASAIDHQTLVNLIAANNGGRQQKAEEYVGKIESVLNKVMSSAQSKKESGMETRAESEEKTRDLQSRVKAIFQQKSGNVNQNINQIKSDFTSLFSSAGNNKDLKYKLKNYNKEQMLELVETRTSMPREKAEPIVEKIVEARDTVIRKSDEIEHQVRTKLEQAKQEALAQAENTRAVAASAAWWLVATALVSGVASAIGGILALDSWFV